MIMTKLVGVCVVETDIIYLIPEYPESHMGETLYILIRIVPILSGCQLDSPELSGDHQQDNK